MILINLFLLREKGRLIFTSQRYELKFECEEELNLKAVD